MWVEEGHDYLPDILRHPYTIAVIVQEIVMKPTLKIIPMICRDTVSNQSPALSGFKDLKPITVNTPLHGLPYMVVPMTFNVDVMT